MEKYQGVKFHYRHSSPSFSYDSRLSLLNHWAFLFSHLGLAPVHASGAYGNHSYRTGNNSFIITRSAMQPTEVLRPADFCHVLDFDESSASFLTEGTAPPSSESFLHRALYQALPHINAILHGHSPLLNLEADTLSIPTTERFEDYGTVELADSAVSLIDTSTRFFILREHGFVALGENIETAGKLTLDYYTRLITVLKDS